ncbi:hypothetical protein KUTeg_003805 [Tegillarca granosa]|uniref:TASOR pseudo-PARP domain-containing protein n=1 Tax=Tegillarca granosa TaxID=220873 RepID=A0ABQ9FN57_TEGGR|nr:hypothetical protein KUTeg_003805 [Tegillarca granosa]
MLIKTTYITRILRTNILGELRSEGGNMPPKKRIPKRSSTELLQDVKLDGPDAKEVLSNLRRSCLMDENIERLWTPENIQIVQNPELENNYKQRKKEFKDNGRKGKEVEDRLVFAAETWAGVQKICKFGIRCLENKPGVLGDARYGVHLCRHFDTLLKYMAFSNPNKFRYVIVFKAMYGRTKAVTARINDEQEAIEPLPNYDSHISTVKPDMQMEISDAIAHNYIYLYEYDEDTSYPVQFPRHVLPYAVIHLSRTKDSIAVPLKWGGGTKKVVKKNNGGFKTTQRKTWNSRAAAYCAGVSGETLKENISFLEDTKTSIKTEMERDSNRLHDIKPCKIEICRSDMHIDERFKIPSNFEFDTASGTKLIATKTGFIKDTCRSFGNSDLEGDSFETNNNDIRGQTVDLNRTPMLQKIKKEPVGSDTQEDPYTNDCSSFDIKQERSGSFINLFDKAENNMIFTSEAHHFKSLDKIPSNKELILKRLQQVEREIHWKKQKIDELQKQSSRNIKKEKDNISRKQLEASILQEANSQQTTESKLDTSEICMLQNENNRSLSLNLNIRDQQSDGDTEGDSTPTLDEPREVQLNNTGSGNQNIAFACTIILYFLITIKRSS